MTKPVSRTRLNLSKRNRKPTKVNCSTLISQLMSADISELRNRYRDTFKQDAPPSFGPDLLRRSIAYRLQCQAYGGLSPQTEKLLRTIAQQSEEKPNGPIEVKRKIKAGSELIRTWKGQTYRVVVATEGFRYSGKIYSSLSEIASEITGTNWNGPRFFGLRSKPSGLHANGN